VNTFHAANTSINSPQRANAGFTFRPKGTPPFWPKVTPLAQFKIGLFLFLLFDPDFKGSPLAFQYSKFSILRSLKKQNYHLMEIPANVTSPFRARVTPAFRQIVQFRGLKLPPELPL